RPRGKHVVGPVPSSGAAHAALLPAHPVAGEERPPELLAALQEVAHERALLLEPFLHALADRFRAEHPSNGSYRSFMKNTVRLPAAPRAVNRFLRRKEGGLMMAGSRRGRGTAGWEVS